MVSLEISERTYEVTIASSGTYDFGAGDAVVLIESLADIRDHAIVRYKAANEPSVYTTLAFDVRPTDTALKLCAIDNSGALQIKNNTASSLSLFITRVR